MRDLLALIGLAVVVVILLAAFDVITVAEIANFLSGLGL